MKNSSEKFGKSYYIGGAESNYIDYPKRKYNGLAKNIKKILNIQIEDYLFDYGCATGNLLREIRKYCRCAGYDISKFAISYGIKKCLPITNDVEFLYYEWNYFIFLDVLEHMSLFQIKKIFKIININEEINKIIVRIPVAAVEGKNFLLPCSRKDKTHIQCHSKVWWHNLFLKMGFDVCKIIKEKHIYDSDGVLAWVLKKKD